MKVVILAGGLGTRLAEETDTVPKPMVKIGEHPMLWHIMKIYGSQGFRDFIIPLGYKGEVIKRYFIDYYYLTRDLTVSLDDGSVSVSESGPQEDWTVALADTGLQTQTGGRLLRLSDRLTDDGPFMLTYGDGVADIDLEELLEFHRSHGRLVTLTAVRPAARFGSLELHGDKVSEFAEKSRIKRGWINGGFFVVEPEALSYIDGDSTPWEHAPLHQLASDGELMAYKHDSFWHCMDTLRDVRSLDELWNSDTPPWKLWD